MARPGPRRQRTRDQHNQTEAATESARWYILHRLEKLERRILNRARAKCAARPKAPANPATASPTQLSGAGGFMVFQVLGTHLKVRSGSPKISSNAGPGARRARPGGVEPHNPPLNWQTAWFGR